MVTAKVQIPRRSTARTKRRVRRRRAKHPYWGAGRAVGEQLCPADADGNWLGGRVFCAAARQQISLWPCQSPPGEGTRPTRGRFCGGGRPGALTRRRALGHNENCWPRAAWQVRGHCLKKELRWTVGCAEIIPLFRIARSSTQCTAMTKANFPNNRSRPGTRWFTMPARLVVGPTWKC